MSLEQVRPCYGKRAKGGMSVREAWLTNIPVVHSKRLSHPSTEYGWFTFVSTYSYDKISTWRELGLPIKTCGFDFSTMVQCATLLLHWDAKVHDNHG
jgi:hypothetical protein